MRKGVETLRHLEVFQNELFNHKIDVIGCGAVGSRVVMGLVKLGIQDIRVWDFDTVEEHNVANQLFGNQHVGKPKVEALKDIVLRDTGVEIEVRNEAVDGTQHLREVVFCLPDSMEARKNIWENAVKFKPNVRALFEARMGADNGRIYYVDPMDIDQHEKYEQNFYTDEESEESLCGAPITVGPTASITASSVVWSMIRWFRREQGEGDRPIENEFIFTLNPPSAYAFKF